MAKPKKTITQSKTTQNVAVGALGGGGLGVVVAELVCELFSNATGLEVPAEAKLAIAGLISTIVIPFLSRRVADWRQ